MDCSPLNSPGQNARVGRLSLLQGIFPTKELNPGLPYRSQILYQLSHQVSNNQDSEVTVVFSPSFPTNFKLTTAFPLLFFCSESLPLSFSSVQFSHSVMSSSLRPHELHHTKLPCLSPTPRVQSNSRPLSRWCHPAISSSVIPFSSCPQSLPASESFPMSQVFAWGGQSTGVAALTSFLPKNTQGWSL